MLDEYGCSAAEGGSDRGRNAVGPGTGASLVHIVRAQQHVVAQRGKTGGVGATNHARSEDADSHGAPVPLLPTMGMDPSPSSDAVAARPR